MSRIPGLSVVEEKSSVINKNERIDSMHDNNPTSKTQPANIYQVQDAPELGIGVKVVLIGRKYFLLKGEDLLPVDYYDDGKTSIKITDKGLEFAIKEG